MTVRARRRKDPLEVNLTFRVNFGTRPDEALTLIDNQRVPFAGSVFENRDRIVRGFVRLLVKAGVMQPRVLGAIRTFKRRFTPA